MRLLAPSLPRLSNNKGFTLLEMLVVILIIGMLTGIVAPRFINQLAKSEATTARAQLSSIDKALQAFRIDTGRFPTTSEGLAALSAAPNNEDRWRGPYLQSVVPPDPWGQPYQYVAPGKNGREYDLSSKGRDRAVGGDGDNADIVLP